MTDEQAVEEIRNLKSPSDSTKEALVGLYQAHRESKNPKASFIATMRDWLDASERALATVAPIEGGDS